ncbi:MAG TPA: aldo/keto reductase [Bacteroidaceae bacterium]|nr:aldo/keto reductase [Bacteroidaceae bacterium]
MKYRQLGKTGFKISEISLGTWQVGGKWGELFDDRNAESILNKAIDAGINFIDTADVYSDGQSESAIGRVLKSRSERVYVATKCGRKLSPHDNASYKPEVLRVFVEESLKRLQIDVLDLIQLHCPPTEVYERPEIFELFDRLKEEGKILNMGVSVEKVDEALRAIEYPNVTTVQIIFNMFRFKPMEQFFPSAKKENVGIIVRVPLASGLLTGKFTYDTEFSRHDHRFFNRGGMAFDKGETFSGVDYRTGIAAVEQLKKLFPGQDNLAPAALKWILMFDAVSCVIPGASNAKQLDSNLTTLELENLTEEQMNGVREIYESMIKESVHHLW